MAIVIMGNDAGSTNYGYSVVKVFKKKGKIRYKILECGQLQNQIKDLKTEVLPSLKKFYKEVKSKHDKYKVEYSIYERFLPRGRFGNTSEYVNIMIGYSLAKLKNVELVTASTWKNRLNKFLGGKGALEKYAKCVEVPQHEIDATFQALFMAEKILGEPILYKFSSIKEKKKLKSQIESCTLSQKIKRRSSLV